MKYAAIDIGTNSCRLIIVEVTDNGLNTLKKQVEITRIGEGLSKSSNLSPDAINRTISCLNDFKKTIENHKAQSFRVIATNAVREAKNQEDFLLKVKEQCGLEIDVISSDEEAKLSYLGVEKGLKFEQLPVLVDLGGGSTEFIFNGEYSYVNSIPIGAVKVTENNMSIFDIKNIFREILEHKEKFENSPLAFVGGTATSLVAIKEGMETYKPDIVHGYKLKREEVADLYNLLERMPLNVRKRLPGLQPERADIITGGAKVVLLIMDLLEKNEITISESDIMEGTIWSLLN
ncbi:Exopolyphosphatase [Candidatus Syntrophocurvum alkaliphilum]|uniref:Exopolyphosphatase n=1 Tax=Candidatus Syntrophocurvum alkaliphilum TaxID=2293317 RepID=A0A6I6DKR9_9FIRM|nr:Ppx/GppA phosphatase family protein [Candidatus Syntrophocurvum alkaliphilum]QGU00520.1 Exopolyphosphatase [Candidatus Syntrophocurvum alkaliphilum]